MINFADIKTFALARFSPGQRALSLAGVVAVDTGGAMRAPDGSAISMGGAPGGATNTLQFNNAGVLGAMSGTVWNDVLRTLSMSGGTLTTTGQAMLDLGVTFNGAGQTLTGLRVNVIDNASAAASPLLDLQVGGATKVSARKDGSLMFGLGGGSSTPNLMTGLGALVLGASTNVSVVAGSLGNWTAIFEHGNALALYNSTGVGFSGSNAAADLFLRRAAANTLALRNGANAQSFQISRSYVDGANYGFTELKQDATAGFIVNSVNAGSVAAPTNVFDFRLNGVSAFLLSAAGSTVATLTGDLKVDNGFHTVTGIRLAWDTLGISSNTSIGFSSGLDASTGRDLFLLRAGPNALAQRNSTNPQAFQLSRSYVDSLNYGHTSLRQDATTGFIVDSAYAGTVAAPTNLFDLRDNGVSRVNVSKAGILRVLPGFDGGTITFVNDGYGLQYYSSGTFRLGFGDFNSNYFSLGSFGIAVGGGQVLAFSNQATIGHPATMDVVLRRDAANTLALRNASAAQAINLYRNYVDGANLGYSSLKQDSTAGFILDNVYSGTVAAPTNLLDVRNNGTTMLSVDKFGLVSSPMNLGGGFRANLSNGIGFEARWGASFVIASIASTDGSGRVTVSGDGAYQFASSTLSVASPDVLLRRDAAGVLAQRNGTAAQAFRVYNTYTDSANGEWGAVRWNSGALEIGVFANGTGNADKTIRFMSAGFAVAQLNQNSLSLSTGINLNGYNINSAAFIAQTSYHQMASMTPPAAPPAGNIRIYADTSGGGKVRLMVQFPTGAAQVIATEP